MTPHFHQSEVCSEEGGGAMPLEEAGGFHDAVKGVGTPGFPDRWEGQGKVRAAVEPGKGLPAAQPATCAP